jgi:hypothetical protein
MIRLFSALSSNLFVCLFAFRSPVAPLSLPCLGSALPLAARLQPELDNKFALGTKRQIPQRDTHIKGNRIMQTR